MVVSVVYIQKSSSLLVLSYFLVVFGDVNQEERLFTAETVKSDVCLQTATYSIEQYLLHRFQLLLTFSHKAKQWIETAKRCRLNIQST